ncbi:thiamine pyrophosphate-dependent enzyme, partial [Zavarzinia sp.]|uniref:thiamine pyrophosphate-dependent enzyme n=1 Tax=Zavarzinia sp. TaxID=2027920 RepID=UPI003BB75715
RPLIVAGGGAVGGAAPLRWIAEHLSAPVITTINAKGLLPPDHDLLAGENLAAEPLRAELAKADVVLAVGTEFGETEMYPGPVELVIPGKLIRIDLDPEQLMRGPRADLPILGDADLSLRDIAVHLEHTIPKLGGDIRAKALRKAMAAQLPDYARRHIPVMAAIDKALPDAIVVGDSAEPVYAANQFFHPRGLRRFFNASTGYGTLGYGLPAGIGARLGRPDLPVVVLAGDGGVLFTIAELAAAVEARVPVIVVLWNNGGYGEIRNYMTGRGITPIAVDLVVPDLVAVAKGFGCAAERIADLDHFAAALAAAKTRDVPTVLELVAGHTDIGG